MGGGWGGLHSHFHVKPNRCVVLGWGFDNRKLPLAKVFRAFFFCGVEQTQHAVFYLLCDVTLCSHTISDSTNRLLTKFYEWVYTLVLRIYKFKFLGTYFLFLTIQNSIFMVLRCSDIRLLWMAPNISLLYGHKHPIVNFMIK